MGEKPENPFLLQQARNESKIRLGVLHAIFTRGVAAGEFQLVVAEPMSIENAGDNLVGGLVLEYAVIARQGQPPEPRTQCKLVALAGGVGGELADFDAEGVEVALFVVVVQGCGQVRGHGVGQDQRGNAESI
ncbi:hypothetical protein D9M68_868780 [compost metagenome]